MKKKNIAFWIGILSVIALMIACKEPKTTTARRMDIKDAIFASGTVEQEQNYSIASKADGQILSLKIREGDSIAVDAVIAKVESELQQNQLQDALVVYEEALSDSDPNAPQLKQLQTQMEQVQQQLKKDEQNYLRYKELLAKKSVAQLDFERVELQYQNTTKQLEILEKTYEDALQNLEFNKNRTRIQLTTQQDKLKDYQLRAKKAGVVTKVLKKEGELTRRGEVIAQIGSGAYIIKLLIAEEDITKVELGQTAAISLNIYPNQTFEARVTKIYPAFDELEQSYIVESQFNKLPPKLFSGTQLQANIEIGTRKNVMVIPTSYLLRGNRVQLVDGTEKEVVIGSKNDQWTEIISGISEEDILLKP